MDQSLQVGHTPSEAVEFPIRGIRAFNSFFDVRSDLDFLRERRPMGTALVLSLLIHALLLSLSFGGQGFGFPGLGLPWRERRFEADDLRVVLVPAQVTAAAPVSIKPSADLVPTGMAKPKPIAARDANAVKAVRAPSPAGGPGNLASPPVPTPPLIALDRSDTATLVVPVVPLVPTPRDAGDAAQKQIEPEVREQVLGLAKLDSAKQEAQAQADQIEAARQLATREEAEHIEAARIDAERQETARQAAVRQEAERVEAARLDAERQETARQAAVRREAEHVDAARLDAERLETARQAAVRHEAERGEAARLDAERQETARQDAAGQEKAQKEAARAEQEAKREAVLRAIGRQLDEEAAKREAASLAAGPSSPLLGSSSSARRVRLFGRTDPNAELILYAEAWSRKIELNMTFDMVREAAKQRYTNPLVTVALRSDGSVESVTIVVSSGVAAIDEAIRRIVQSQAPYPSFPPGLAREYDVIEIRRSWYFDMAVRLF
jgi:TonB family protein